MNITKSQHDDIHIIQPQGRVDSVGTLDLELALQAVYEVGGYRVILDLSHVSYINSAGLRVLAAMLTRAQDNGGNLLLVSPTPKVRRILHIIGFDHFFSVLDSVEAAVRAF